VASVVDDTAAILDDLGADRAYVLGWSGGGPHAIACAALLPDRVISASTIASAAPHTAEGLDPFEGMGQENIDALKAQLAGHESHIASLERDWPTMRDVTAEVIADALGDLIDDVDRGALTGDVAEFLAANMREGLRESYRGWYEDDVVFVEPWGFELDQIRRPVHIWQGGHDRMVPFAHGTWLASHIPTACAHLFPEHGHLSLAIDSFPAILDEMSSGA
jgi:pimeloyl-ACP methyl ester carboxylesterase